MNVPEMMTPDEALESYRPLVEDNEQAIPVLVYATEGAVQPVGLIGVPPGGMQDALAGILDQMRTQLGSPVWLLFSNEAHMKMIPAESDFESYRPGDLAREAESNPDLAECVNIVGVSRDTQWARVVPFVRTKHGLTWDEPMDMPALGGVPDILIEAVK